jgi:hypothetical protein
MALSADSVVFWRRTDVEALERLVLAFESNSVRVVSTAISVEDGGFRLDHKWELTSDWRAMSLHVERLSTDGRRLVVLERHGNAWWVDGELRPDLDAADEPDLSVTPFCNTLPIRRLLSSSETTLTIDVAYVNGKDLTVKRSRQRYDRLGPLRFRYIDLGLSEGFQADLDVDDQGLVRRYEHLFERLEVRP